MVTGEASPESLGELVRVGVELVLDLVLGALPDGVVGGEDFLQGCFHDE